MYNYGLAVTPNGEILLGGEGYSSWLGAGNAAPLHAYSGDADITLLQLNADGSYAWHSFYGSDSYDAAYDVVADGVGNLLVVGSSDISWLGDGDAAPLSPHSDDYDITLLKFAGGQYLPAAAPALMMDILASHHLLRSINPECYNVAVPIRPDIDTISVLLDNNGPI